MTADPKSPAGSASAGHTFPELVRVMKRLLGPDGCPWDREQTLDSLVPYLVEETYEVLDALERGGADEHCEELGDLLMQIVFQAELRAERGEFAIDDVIGGIARKLVRRHPHIFGDARADDAEQVAAQWDAIKARERAGKSGGRARALAGVPRGAPALSRAQQISARAARVGFDWPDTSGCRAKVEEELGELDHAIAAGDDAAAKEELGDLLFAVVSLARKIGCDAETALRHTTDKFSDRFAYVEDRLDEAGRSPAESSLSEMDRFWEEAKRTARSGGDDSGTSA